MNEAPESEFPCEECGRLVDLSTLVTVSMNESDGSNVATRMSELEARALLDDLGIPRPPVLCNAHESQEIVTEAVGA